MKTNKQFTTGFGVGSSDIFDLTPLANLTSIGGSLIILRNPLLTNLNDLSNLTSVGDALTVGINNQLSDISGLSNAHNPSFHDNWVCFI